MYRYLFGPVPSRRLGISLGIDLFVEKTCSLNCIYCEAGRTQHLTAERAEYVPTEQVIEELEHYRQNHPSPDYVTFSGSGEPTLHSHIDVIIAAIRNLFEDSHIAVLTNGTLLHDPSVRHSLLGADLVVPSLDAASDAVFQRINRPVSGLTVEKHIAGLCDFRREFAGQYWLEIFIVAGLNDGNEELALLKSAITCIKPDRIQLNTLDRPAPEINVTRSSEENLMRIKDFLAFPETDIIARPKQVRQAALSESEAESRILQTVTRRPCTLEDLITIVGLPEDKVNIMVNRLVSNGLLTPKQEERGTFFMPSA